MKERPLLMRGEMVWAILDGRKSQTRRVLKRNASGRVQLGKKQWHIEDPNAVLACPYGQPGDRLWAKETHLRWGKWVKAGKTKNGKQAWRFKVHAPNRDTVIYVAGEPTALPKRLKRAELGWHKRPSIFMPRWASRITLEIVSVGVERVQNITGSGILAEGACPSKVVGGERDTLLCVYWIPLWDSINSKKHPWSANPFVWVITFKKL